jgi:hypothetical protein
MIVKCRHEPPHTHEYPDDWEFGGANGTDPAADPRWRGDTYTYWSDEFQLLELTSAMRCDDQALDHFSKVAEHFPKSNPHYIQVRRYGTNEVITLPFRYDRKTDEVYDAF